MLKNNYNNLIVIWLNFVVPFTRKFISYNMDFFKFSITLTGKRMLATIKKTGNWHIYRAQKMMYLHHLRICIL